MISGELQKREKKKETVAAAVAVAEKETVDHKELNKKGNESFIELLKEKVNDEVVGVNIELANALCIKDTAEIEVFAFKNHRFK